MRKNSLSSSVAFGALAFQACFTALGCSLSQHFAFSCLPLCPIQALLFPSTGAPASARGMGKWDSLFYFTSRKATQVDLILFPNLWNWANAPLKVIEHYLSLLPASLSSLSLMYSAQLLKSLSNCWILCAALPSNLIHLCAPLIFSHASSLPVI